MKEFIKQNEALLYKTLKELCLIPAPSHFEKERADYCKRLLEGFGAKGVYIDDALNVVYPINCEGSDKITVFVAHTDTVFPDTEPMPYSDDGSILRCPGVGDDTASLAVLLLLAKYLTESGFTPENGIMLVCNSCEEGLGNLKGTRQLFKDYDGRIAQFVSFDSKFGSICDSCAGSHRYEVEVLTEGGHSYSAFGKPNAINELSKLVNSIYSIKLPEKPDTRTTYNVGNISGGTSVNTIAQSATMLCEYRSDDKECLEYMKNQFEMIFKNAASDKVFINVNKIGDRPCADIDDSKLDKLRQSVKPIIDECAGVDAIFKSASTDCNIPLSLGIPAICIGVYKGGGSHTREEWVEKASLPIGLEIAIKTAHAIS